jgi:hypothetical protein
MEKYMIEKLSTALRKYANGWLVLLFLAGEVFFNAVILPAQQANIEAASGGTGPIDLLFFYTPEKVYGMIAAYGDQARASYRLFELTGDILYPIVYTLFFSLAITWLFQRGFTSTSPMQKYNVVPFGGWFFDLLENLGIVAMLSVYPATPALLAWGSAVFTLIKWIFAIASGVLLLIGLGMAIKNGFKKQA